MQKNGQCNATFLLLQKKSHILIIAGKKKKKERGTAEKRNSFWLSSPTEHKKVLHRTEEDHHRIPKWLKSCMHLKQMYN